jgi:hypothetical protein
MYTDSPYFILFVPGARYHLSYRRLNKVKVLGCLVSPVHDYNL